LADVGLLYGSRLGVTVTCTVDDDEMTIACCLKECEVCFARVRCWSRGAVPEKRATSGLAAWLGAKVAKLGV